MQKNIERVVLRTAALALIVGVLSAPALAEDWTRFRGNDASGIAQATNLPATWDSKKNVIWSSKLPGAGTSCPTVYKGRVYLTCYSGYAQSHDNVGDQTKLMRHVVCLDRKTGDIIWQKDFKPVLPESVYKKGNNGHHGYASSTIATDGQALYIFFGISGAYALDLEGNILWNTKLGGGTHGWGSATSPLLYKDLVIVNASVESTAMYALNKKTGKQVWKTEGVIKSCWASPVLVDVKGKQELVLNVPKRLTGYDPATGAELWHCEGLPDGYLCPTVVSADGVVYAVGARKNTTMAVRAGGRGDVGATHVLWSVPVGNNVSSPVLLDGRLYYTHEKRGILYCLDAKTGKTISEGIMDPRPDLVYSSITVADGKIYAPSQHTGTYVFAAQPEFKQLAVNKLQDDPSRINASVVVTDNQILLRSEKALYCIGQ